MALEHLKQANRFMVGKHERPIIIAESVKKEEPVITECNQTMKEEYGPEKETEEEPVRFGVRVMKEAKKDKEEVPEVPAPEDTAEVPPKDAEMPEDLPAEVPEGDKEPKEDEGDALPDVNQQILDLVSDEANALVAKDLDEEMLDEVKATISTFIDDLKAIGMTKDEKPTDEPLKESFNPIESVKYASKMYSILKNDIKAEAIEALGIKGEPDKTQLKAIKRKMEEIAKGRIKEIIASKF